MSIFGCPTVVGLNALADERARQPEQCVGACMHQEGARGRQHLRRNAREGVRSAGSLPPRDRGLIVLLPCHHRLEAPENARRAD